MNDPIKIIIVEDHSIFREGLVKVLGRIHNVEIIGEAENGKVFLEMLDKYMPDIVLMDIKMPVMGGVEATEKAMQLYPDLKIIILSMFGEEEYLYNLVLLGISGFLLKNTTMANLGKAIEMVADGQQYFSPELNGKLAKRLKQYSTIEIPQFTSKEIDVLRFLAKGLSSDEIAGELNMSRRTVEGYRAKLLEKTESTNTINLIIYALRNKLIIFDELEPEKNS